MKKEPLISVIIPVYNGGEFIDEALKSVFSQTYSNIEIIVVDDGSTDNSSEIVRKYPDLHYIYQENQGVSVARNTAILASKGTYIAFLDADDLWMPDKLTIQMKYILRNKEYRIITTEKENFMQPGTQLPDSLKSNYKWETVGENIPSTMLVHRSVFDEIGYYSREYSSGEDREWLWRAKDADIPLKKIDKVLVRRRFHGSNLSWKNARSYKTRTMRIIRESVTRQERRSE